MDEILKKIASRADKAQAHGRDVSEVKTLIAEAATVIGAARQAILNQSGKTYTIAISATSTDAGAATSTALRIDVGRTRQALHADLVKVREMVFAAREAVRKAAVALAQIPKVDELEVEQATSTESSVSTSTTSTGTSTNQ